MLAISDWIVGFFLDVPTRGTALRRAISIEFLLLLLLVIFSGLGWSVSAKATERLIYIGFGAFPGWFLYRLHFGRK